MTTSASNVPGRIFLSYRRMENDTIADWLFDRLVSQFGRDHVFMDVDSIEPGDDFVKVITRAVRSCDVMLALIGKEWLTITDQDGRRRLDNPSDFVRLEIETALAHDVLVIPVLVKGAQMPNADGLPVSLAELAHRQAFEISPIRPGLDIQQLMGMLDRAVAAAQGQARQEAERAAVRRRQQIEQLQGKIRERAVAKDWDSVVAVSGELAAIDPVAADPDGLASAARAHITRRRGALGKIGSSQRHLRRVKLPQLNRTAWIFFGVASISVALAGVLIFLVPDLRSPAQPAKAHNPGQSSKLSFRDDFSTSANGWTVYGQDISGRYANGKYLIYLKSAATSFGIATSNAHVLNPPPSNITIEATARAAAGAADLSYGIVCRSDVAGNNQYSFGIDQGVAAIAKYDYRSQNAGILASGSLPSPSANGGYQLRATCSGGEYDDYAHLVFWVNGVKIGDVTDRTNPIGTGTAGLFAGRVPGTKGAAEAEFDRLVVTQT